MMHAIRRNADVMWREEADALAAVQSGLERGDDVAEIGTATLFSGGVMLSVNILGMEIWKLCDGRDLDGIVAALLSQFDADEETLSVDVLAFLNELKQKGFITYEE